jgi:uncharacterized protein YciI
LNGAKKSPKLSLAKQEQNMPKWSDYKETARNRGSLAFELFIVESTPALAPDDMMKILPEHLSYQQDMERAGKLFLAGPLSDASGEEMSGAGMIVYKAHSFEEALAITSADPMHQRGGRTFTLRRWLVNEGALTLSVGLSTKGVALI